MSHPTVRFMTVGSALAGILLAGCGDEVEPLDDGRVEVAFEVSPHGCQEAGVEVVEVRLENAHRHYDEAVDCQEGEVFFDSVAPAEYEVTASGFDADERQTFSSDAESLTAKAEQTVTVSGMRLTAKPASVEVTWSFDNGRVCGANEVDEVEVGVYDEAYYEVGRGQFDCNAGSGELDGFVAGHYIVEVVGRGESSSTYRGVADLGLKRGDEAVVEVLLEEDD